MRDFAASLYKSKRWQHTRTSYLASVGGLCERCMAVGLIKPAVIVHHKMRVTPETIHDPAVTLAFDNLEALCRECHEAEHADEKMEATTLSNNSRRRAKRRYSVDEYGRVTYK